MAEKNPSDNTFDNISRILASPMPRRQAVKTVVGALVTAAAAANWWPENAFAAALTKTKSILTAPVDKLSVVDAQVYEVIEVLRQQFNAPVSYIDAADKSKDSVYDPKKPYAPARLTAVGHPPISLNVTHGTVRAVLDAIVKQDPSYCWKMISGRLILYPNQAKFNTVVSGVKIRNKSRTDATVDYIFLTLGKRVPGFESYGAMLGRYDESTNTPEYTTPVTLSPSATVLQQMLELLGDDPSLCFSIYKLPNGISQFSFDSVPSLPRTSRASARRVGVVAQSGASLGALAQAHPVPLDDSHKPCYATNVSYKGRQSSTQNPYCGGEDVYLVGNLTLCPGSDCTGYSESEGAVQIANTGNAPRCSSSPPGTKDANTKGCGTILNTNSFCTPPDPKTGKMTCCLDHFAAPGLIGPQFSQPGYMCQDTFLQTITVNNFDIAVNTMVFTRTVNLKGRCSVSISPPAFTSIVTCCGIAPSGPDAYTLCRNATEVCVSDNGIKSAICCPTTVNSACNQICCQPGYGCVQDAVSFLNVCCPSGTSLACNGMCCTSGQTCTAQTCCPQGQATSDNKMCCSTTQTACATDCCDNTTQVCTKGVCCGKPKPQARMSHTEILRGRYATDDLSQCCAQGQVPCGDVCCPSGQSCADGICCPTGQTNCNGQCCAGACCNSSCCGPKQSCCSDGCCSGSCDSTTGACITGGEN